MQPNPNNLLKIAEITTPLIGFYDVPEIKAFEPFAHPNRCFFSCYENWLKGESVCISKKSFGCPGAGHWLCGVESMTREKLVKFLVEQEGLKCSIELMNQWLDNQKGYQKKHEYLVIGPLKEDQYDYLKTITFYVTPDQLSLLLIGAEYKNTSPKTPKVQASFGSGCSQLIALFENLESPRAMISSTDIAMRQYLPANLLSFTVTKAMFQQLCELDERSFLYKPFWENLKKSRQK